MIDTSEIPTIARLPVLRPDPEVMRTSERRAIVTRIRWIARHVRSLRLYTRP